MARALTAGLAFLLFFAVSLSNVSAEHCERKVPFFGKVKFSCPEPGDPIDYRYCCRDGDNGKCCSIDKSFEGLDVDFGKVIAWVLGVVGAFILTIIICCCVCPCCLCYKRRKTGVVYHSATVPNEAQRAVNVTVTPAPAAVAPAPVAGYVNHPTYPPQTGYSQQPGFHSQPPYAGQPVYPPQYQPPYPPTGYPGNPGYPPVMANNPIHDQPPPYEDHHAYQKQAPFNPNY